MSTSKHFRNDQTWTNAYAFHKKLIKNYMHYYRGKIPTNIPENYKSEKDIIRENHRFIRSETDKDASWEQRVAKKYYDTLFKEYAICELKYYKQGKIALRWRTEKEVVAGKGQFICGSTRCDASNELKSWEVNFGYVEDGEKKNELVKVRLCPECSDSLNYKTQKRQAKSKKMEDKKNKRKRTHSEEEDDDNEEDEDHEDHDRKGKKSKRSSDKYEHNDDRKSEHANSIWSKPIESKEERTKEEEYEDYFADLLQ